MSDVSAIFGTLLVVGLAFPGMLVTWWLLFPAPVERARRRLEATPWKALWLGLGVALAFAVPILVLVALPIGPAKFLGWSLLAGALAVSGIGAAGLAAHMGAALAQRSSGLSPSAAFLRGALALELAAVFPLLGWFLFVPLAVLACLGATAFALLKWAPRARDGETAPAVAAASGI